jgi:CRP/FNR family transcriptional regulator
MVESLLAKAALFKDLPASDRQQLARAATRKTYAKGETLYREGQAADAVWLVQSGRVHLMRFHDGGHVSTNCVMTDGELFCCLPALDQKAYPTDAVAATDAEVVRIPLAVFSQVMERQPAFRRQATGLFCDRLREVESKGCAIYDPVEKRLAQVLLTLTKKFGATIPLTRQDLAELASTTVETAIRVLSRFKRDGIIRSARGQTTIVHPEKLQQIAASAQD